jgi:hypothetical protein
MLDVRPCRKIAAGVCCLVLSLSITSSAAEAPAGIVMAVTGTTDPPVSVMTEIPTGTPIRLSSEGKLTFLDYARCKLVTVAGGTLTLSRTDYKTDGRVESETDGPCPHVYSLNEPGGAGRTTGGLVMRGGSEAPRWAVNSEFLLTGSRSDKIRTAMVYAEDRPDTPAATLEIRGGRAVQPPGMPPLLPNTRYVLRLMTSDRPKPTEVTFIASAPSGPRSVVVLRFD